ncbi:MAG: S8 family serine peptidase [Candidatus Coatesbacteria bacterium]
MVLTSHAPRLPRSRTAGRKALVVLAWLVLPLPDLTAHAAPARSRDASAIREIAWQGGRIEAIADEVIIRWKAGTGAADRTALAGALGLAHLRDLRPARVQLLHAGGGRSLEAVLDALVRNPNVEWAEPNGIMRAMPFSSPNDPYYQGTLLPAQTYLTQILADKAWNDPLLTGSKGSASLVVAVVDTGVDYTHPDFDPGSGASRILTAPSGPGPALTGGFVVGRDAFNGDDDPMDDNMHGTMVAGFIGAATNNAIGIAGVTWEPRIMPIKVMSPQGWGNWADIVEGIEFAKDHGAHVVNMSLGGPASSLAMREAVRDLASVGIVIIAAAGNSANAVNYPGAYPEVIAVGSVDEHDQLSSFSCFGPPLALVAPGQGTPGLISTYPGGAYDAANGTSFASPITAGVAALALSQNPDWAPETVRRRLIGTADRIAPPAGNYYNGDGFEQHMGHGRLNAYHALGGLGRTPYYFASAYLYESVTALTPAAGPDPVSRHEFPDSGAGFAVFSLLCDDPEWAIASGRVVIHRSDGGDQEGFLLETWMAATISSYSTTLAINPNEGYAPVTCVPDAYLTDWDSESPLWMPLPAFTIPGLSPASLEVKAVPDPNEAGLITALEIVARDGTGAAIRGVPVRATLVSSPPGAAIVPATGTTAGTPPRFTTSLVLSATPGRHLVVARVDDPRFADVSTTATVTGVPRLVVRKQANPAGYVCAGRTVDYAISWTKGGWTNAFALTITDTLPNGTAFSSGQPGLFAQADALGTPALTSSAWASSAAGPWTPGLPAPGTAAPLVLRWVVDRVAPGRSGSIGYRIAVSSALAQGSLVTNRASATFTGESRAFPSDPAANLVDDPVPFDTHAAAPDTVSSGQSFDVTLTVTNTGSGTTAASPAIAVVPAAGLVTLVSGPVPAGPFPVPAGSAQTFTWHFLATGTGRAAFNATAGANPCDGDAAGTLVQVPALMDARLAAVPNPASTGQSFMVTLTVTNTGQAALAGLTMEPLLLAGTGNAGLLAGPWPVPPLSLPGGSAIVFTWTFTATLAGPVRFSTTVTAADANSGVAMPAAHPAVVLTVQRPAVLEGGPLTAQPDPVCGGNLVSVVATVTNTGEAAALDVGGPALSPGGSGGIALVSSPPPVARLEGGQRTSLTWVYRATAGGSVEFTATVAGRDANSGSPLDTGPWVSPAITVLASAWLTGSLSIPAGACTGRWFEVALTVTDTAAVDIPGVTPWLTLDQGAGLVESISGPSPSGPVTIAAGSRQVFVWTLSVSGQGAVALTGRAQAADPVTECLLAAISSGTLVTGTAGELASTLTVSPSTAAVGQPVTVVLDASNPGTGPLFDLSPALVCHPAGGAASLVTGPTPAGPVVLDPGGSVSFTWTYLADAAGSVVFTATVTGEDACLHRPVSVHSVRLDIATALVAARCPPNEVWSVDYDSPANYADAAAAVAVDGAGNAVVAGHESRYDIFQDGNWLIRKYGPAGNLIWTVTYDSPAHYFDRAYAVAIDGGGNIIVAGAEARWDLLQGNNWHVRKYDSDGALLWSRSYNSPGNGDDQAVAVAADAAGNIVVAGYEARTDLGQGDNWRILKYDPDGALLWSRSYTGPGSGSDRAEGVAVDSAGDIVVAGYENRLDLGQGNNWLVRRYDPDGSLLWERSYNSPANSTDQATAVAIDPAGRIVVAGSEYRWDIGQDSDQLVRTYDAAGNLLWTKSYNDPGNGYDTAHAVSVDVNGRVLLAGSEYRADLGTNYDWRMVLFDSTGEELWSVSYDGPAGGYDEAYGVAIAPSGDILLAGSEDRSDAGQAENWRVIRYRPTSACVVVSLTVTPPNPAMGDIVLAALTAENPGTGTLTGVSPSIWIPVNPLAMQLLAGPVPPGPVALGPGASQTFLWTFSVTGVGNVQFTATATGIDQLTGLPVSGEDSDGCAIPCVFTNGILTVECTGESADNAGMGQFTVRTGEDHPHPNQNVIYPSQSTSYFSVRDVDGLTVWTNEDGYPTVEAGYTAGRMSDYPCSLTALGPKEFRATYNLPDYIVIEDVAISGSSLADSKVRHTVSVNNITASARQYGVRYLWDWMIASSDDSWFRSRDPDGVFSDTFVTFAPPDFPRYEQVDFPSSPTFSVFGSVSGCDVARPATQPDELRYASWGTSVGEAWDFVNTGSGTDSAMVYYWGKTAPLTIGPGESFSFTQYVTTEIGSLRSTASLFKDSSPSGAVLDGTELTYTISWRTVGGDTLYGLTITDNLPALTRYRSPSLEFWARPDDLGTPSLAGVAWSPSIDGPWTAGEPPDLADVPLLLRWVVDRAAPDRSGFIRYRLVVSATAFEPGAVIANSASATVFLGSRTSISNEVVNPVGIDIRLTKTPSGWILNRGMPFAYTIDYANAGAMTASQVALWDTLPPGADFVACSGGLSCTVHEGIVTWQLPPDLPPGSSGTVSVTVSANGSGLTLGPNIARFGYRDEAGKVAPDKPSNPVSVFLVTPRIALAKFASQEVVPDGSLLDYYLQITNWGTDRARDIVVWDTLPPGAGFVACSGGTTCAFDGTKVVFTIDQLVPGAAATLAVTVSATGALDGAINRGAAGFLDSATQWLGPVTSNPVTVAIAPGSPELVKEALPADGVPAGGEILYTIRWTNTAGGIVRGLVITDALPPGTSYSPASLAFAAYPDWAGAPSLTASAYAPSTAGPWTAGEPPGGTPAPLVLRWTVDRAYPGSSGWLAFRVRTSATLAEGDPVCNAASATLLFDAPPRPSPEACTLVRRANLVLTMTVSGSPVPDGSLVTYTLRTFNAGSDTAIGISLLDTLPAGVVYDHCDGGAFDGVRVGWALADLGPGRTVEVWFTATITATTPSNRFSAWFTNTALAPGSAISNPVTVAVTPGSPELVKEALPAYGVPAGGEILYTIRWTNTAGGIARGLVITDTMPPGTRYAAPSLGFLAYPDPAGTPSLTASAYGPSTAGPWTAGEPADGTAPPLVLRWTVDRAYPGASGWLAFRVRTSATLAEGDTVCNAASATLLFDARPRSSPAACVAVRRANLVLTKTVSGSPVPDGSLVTYTLRTFNAGSDTAIGISLLDTLPAGVVYDHCDGGAFDGVRVGWALADLGPGRTVEVWFTATITATTPSNRFSAWFTNTALAPGSAISNPVTVAITQARLAIRQIPAPAPACLGGLLVYGFSITNTGTDTATSVTVTDTLPAGALYGSCGGGTGCSFDGTHTTWILPNLPPGAGAGLFLTVTVTGSLGVHGARADLANSAAIPQPPAWSNTCTVGVVQARLDLGIVPSIFQASSAGTVVFALTCTNTGTDTIANLALWDTVPAGSTWVAGGTLSGSVASWTLPPLAPGARLTVLLTVAPVPTCSVFSLSHAASASFRNGCGTPQPVVTAAAPPVEVRDTGVTLTKRSSRPGVLRGDLLTYTIEFANHCRDTAMAFKVWDTIPAGAVFDHCGTGCVFDGTKVDWSLPDLPPGAAGSVTLTVSVTGKPLGDNWTTAAFHGVVDGTYREVESNIVSVAILDPYVPPPPSYCGVPFRVYPNPYNPRRAVRGTVKFQGLPPGSTVAVYTLRGLRVWSAVPAPDCSAEWNGRNSANRPVAPGVFFWTVEAGAFRDQGRLIVE